MVDEPVLYSPASKASALSEAQNDQSDGSGYPDLILVSTDYPLQKGLAIQTRDLTGLLPVSESPMPVGSRIVDSLQRLFATASAEGIDDLVIASGYRSYAEQEALYRDSSDPTHVQPAGCSEHETGLAVDIDAATWESQLWLADNAWRFGFILRYPADKEHITGIAYEPWHFRFVGVDAARIISEQGICLEEYLGIEGIESIEGIEGFEKHVRHEELDEQSGL